MINLDPRAHESLQAFVRRAVIVATRTGDRVCVAWSGRVVVVERDATVATLLRDLGEAP